MAATTMSAGRCAASMTASSPAPDAIPVPPMHRAAPQGHSDRQAPRSGRRSADRRRGQRLRRHAPRHRLDPEGVPLRRGPPAVERPIDLSLRACVDGFVIVSPSACRVEEHAKEDADRPERIQPVHTPPWPGIRWLESFTWNCRFMRGFEQVAALRDDGRDYAQRDQRAVREPADARSR